MKERYKVLKKIYPYYLILIKKNNKYYTFYEDKLIYKNIKNLNNLEIEIKKEYENNNYLYYYTKYKLIKLLERRMLNEI